MLAGVFGLTFSARAQEIQLGDLGRPSAGKSGHVTLLTESATLNAGSPQTLELRFRVDPGFHINSHKPADELMIPTTLKLDATPRLSMSEPQFPAGTPFRLKIGAGELLDVYQGEFRVAVRLSGAKPGEGTVTGTLRYQACDNAACFPPRSLPVRVALSVH